jgi:PleD family two-component response regulator
MHNIIIIEDTSLIRMRIIRLLNQNGYDNVLGFSSADQIALNPQLYLNDVDLIITDIGLPGITGIELAKILNNSPKYCNIPIVFISSYRDAKTINEAIKAGGVDYILKPFEDKLLLEKVEKILADPLIIGNEKYSYGADVKAIISMEYERATRGKQPLSFIKLKVKTEDIKSCIKQIKNKIRKIDMVCALDENVISILPLTGENGVEVVFHKIFNEIADYNIEVLNKDFITYNGDGSKSFNDLVEALGI